MTARSLNILTRARSLDVLAATRGLNVLTGPRRLNILTSARGLNVLARPRSLNILTSPRGLNVLTGTGERPRRLDILGLRRLLQHGLRLADFSRALLRLCVGDRRQRRDDCRAHDCCEKSLHRSSHSPSFGLN